MRFFSNNNVSNNWIPVGLESGKYSKVKSYRAARILENARMKVAPPSNLTSEIYADGNNWLCSVLNCPRVEMILIVILFTLLFHEAKRIKCCLCLCFLSAKHPFSNIESLTLFPRQSILLFKQSQNGLAAGPLEGNSSYNFTPKVEQYYISNTPSPQNKDIKPTDCPRQALPHASR